MVHLWLPRDWLPPSARAALARYGQGRVGGLVASLLPLLTPEQAEEVLRPLLGAVAITASLRLVHLHGPRSATPGRADDYGVVSRRVVTTAGVNYLVDAWQNLQEMENMRYHGIGTGTNAEAVGDTALQTELTTQYNPANTRATGSLTEGGSANVFRTVGTNTVQATVTIAEHGLFTQAATGGGTLWDRSVFSGSTVGLTSGDGLQSTYDATFSAGG